MRDLTVGEVRKRGCWYCADSQKRLYAKHDCSSYSCIHDVCPYHVLDDAVSYVDWLRKIGPIKKTGGSLKGSHL